MNIRKVENYLEAFQKRNNDDVKEKKIYNLLDKAKLDSVSKNNEKEAKYYFILQNILKIQQLYITAYNELKNEKYYKGWCNLERCELELKFLIPHFDITPSNDYWLYFIKTHVKKYQSIFPYKIFASPEILQTEKKCSICNKIISIRKPCGHEIGEIYDGQYCYRRVTGIEFLGVSLVEEPLQKYSVMFIPDEKTNKEVDHYNYSVVEYLMKCLKSPFDSWDVSQTETRHPHSHFKTYGRNDKCPCGSEKKYKNCCLKESGVLRPHFQFTFSKLPSKELLGLRYG